MAELKTMTIGDVIEKLIDYRGKTPKKAENGIRLITAKVIKDGFIKEEKTEYISEEIYASWMQRGYPQQHDIVLTTEAPLGEVAQLRTTERISLAQRVILLRGNPRIIDQQFFFQAIKSPFVQAGLQQRATGTTVLGIKQSELRQVSIPYFPLPTQRKIAAILSAYDDMIENNQRRIKIMEEMAQNLYREWFVKFRFPGYQKARFIDSPLGKIPEGWAVVTLGELIAEHIGGGWGNDVKDDKHTEPAWVIRGTDIPDARSCYFSKVPFRYHTQSNLKFRRLMPGNIIFEVSGGSKDQPLGRSLYVSSELLAAFNGDSVIDITRN